MVAEFSLVWSALPCCSSVGSIAGISAEISPGKRPMVEKLYCRGQESCLHAYRFAGRPGTKRHMMYLPANFIPSPAGAGFAESSAEQMHFHVMPPVPFTVCLIVYT